MNNYSVNAKAEIIEYKNSHRVALENYNNKNTSYWLLPEKLIDMYENFGEKINVKFEDNYFNPSVRYHQGQIDGILCEEGNFLIITLYFWRYNSQDLQYDRCYVFNKAILENLINKVKLLS